MILRYVTIALLGLTCLSANPNPQARKSHPRAGRADRVAPKPTYTPADIANATQPDLKLGDKGSGVVRAQILLDRAGFSCGEIDGYFGANLQKALAAYLNERRLPASDTLDATAWNALNADTAPVLLAYNTSQEDVAGPFVKIPPKIEDQAKLDSLGYTSALELLGEKFHVSPQLLSAINPGGNFDVADRPLMVPNVMTMPSQSVAARIVVSKSESSVRAYDAAGKLIAFYVATIGSEHDPLPIGDWKITGVKRNPPFYYNPKLFWDAKPGDGKATIKPGPNNPVGLVWMDLSKEHYGIHGTPEPSRIGHTASHGCIRLTNWDALELAAMVKPGTPAKLEE